MLKKIIGIFGFLAISGVIAWVVLQRAGIVETEGWLPRIVRPQPENPQPSAVPTVIPETILVPDSTATPDAQTPADSTAY